MNSKKFFFVLFAFVGFLLVSCSDEQQSPVTPTDQSSLRKLVREDFTSHEYPTGNIQPGELWTAGGNLFLRNRADHINIESANPFINATNGIITYNANVDAQTGEGHEWGTITFTPDAYPDLEVSGTWNGQVTLTGFPEWTLILQFVGHIRGGSTNGMQVFWDAVVVYTDPYASYWEGNATGYIQYNEN